MKMELHLARAVVEGSNGDIRKVGSCTQMRTTGFQHAVDISRVYALISSQKGVAKSGNGYVYL